MASGTIGGSLTVNGGHPSEAPGLSPAERLKQQHAAEEAHRPSVEDVPDEYDQAHPVDAQAPPTVSPTTRPLSAIAAGKQKVQDKTGAAEAIGKASEAPFNALSDESFPTLGSGLKSRGPTPVSTAWGAKKPVSVSAAMNGHRVPSANVASSGPASRSSTPASGVLTPNSTNASIPSRTGVSHGVSLPGRYSERIQFAPSQLQSRTQLKKPVTDVLRDINKRSKATVEMRPGPGGAVIFEGKGPVDAVRQALKDVALQLGSKQSIKVAIPASVRPFVIGKQGSVVQGISQRTGARIQVPKGDDNAAADDDDSATIDVSVEGDAVAAEMARREIESIVNQRTSTVNMRLKDIPAEFYPFIAGPHNSTINTLENGRDLRIHVPQYHRWTDQPPPQASVADQPPLFVPQAGHHIQISGDRLAALEARAQIERQVEELKRQISSSQIPISRGQHQFIIGERGGSLHDFLAETGCAVVLPPDTDDTEILTVIGPPDRLDQGINKVMDLAASMQMSNVDISRQHSNAPLGARAHAHALSRYLQQRHAIEQLERLHNAHIVIPRSEDGPVSWEVYSRDGKNTIRARSDIINLINGHPPERLTHVDIDPFYHHFLQQQSAPQIRDDLGVHMVFPDDLDQSPQVILVYEDPSTASSSYELPRRQPTSSEMSEFSKSLEEARQRLQALVSGQEDIVAVTAKVPKKYHEKVQKFVNREQQSLSQNEFPVRVGIPAASNGRAIQPGSADDEILLRGPRSSVQRLSEKIQEFVEAAKEDDRERGYTTTFDYPQKFANFLIGKKGENIKNLRDEFDVDIQVNDGKVEVKGPKVKAESAKLKIIALAKKLEDEATHHVKINPEFHRDMIGPKGSQVNRLQDRYNVRINFPRSTNNLVNDDQSIVDTLSEAGAGVRPGRNQAPDEVIIRGPRRGADDARDELLSLLQWTMDHSHTANVSVAQAQLPSLIGQGGREMETLRMSTGAQIDVPARDSADPSGRVLLKVKGTKKQVQEAKALLEAKARLYDDTVTRTLSVDKKHHKSLIGGGGANIRDIVVKAGGPDGRRELARMVRFPRPDSEDTLIRVEGPQTVADKIVESIQNFVKERENRVTDIVEVVPEKHRLLIGRGGETRRQIETQFNVTVDIPKQNTTGAARSAVKISGNPEDVEKAKTHIASVVKDQEGETIQVPRRYHNIISANGQFFRRLKNDHKVTVDHAGHQIPPRHAANSARSRVNGGSLPLITDEQVSPDNFSWRVEDSNAEGEEGEIPWLLRGSADNVAKAKSQLQRAIEQAQQYSTTGYLILPDPNTYRMVVGPGGSQINSIRKQTGCKITVPRDQAKDEAIEIQGSKDGVEKAKDIILDIVRNDGTRD